MICGHCGGRIAIPDEAPGGAVRCGLCGGVIRIADSRRSSSEPAPVAPPPIAAPVAPPPIAAPEPTPPPVVAAQPMMDASEPPAPAIVNFAGRDEDDEEDDLDMTPMVDITFLLLIFFIMTAAFAMQKSLEVPTPDNDESSTQQRTIEEIEQDDDYVIIRIEKDDTVWVNDREAPSEQDLLVKLREARRGYDDAVGRRGPTNLLVMADRECSHAAVVMALDAGQAVGMEHVRMATVDDSTF